MLYMWLGDYVVQRSDSEDFCTSEMINERPSNGKGKKKIIYMDSCQNSLLRPGFVSLAAWSAIIPSFLKQDNGHIDRKVTSMTIF